MNDLQTQHAALDETFMARSQLLTPISHERRLTLEDINGFLDNRLAFADGNQDRVASNTRLS